MNSLTLNYWSTSEGLHVVAIERNAKGYATVKLVGVLWISN